MALSRTAINLHNRAMDYVHSDKSLTDDEREFVLLNFQESYANDNKSAGAFFTPMGLCRDFTIEVGQCNTGIDLCAGIGRLSYYQIEYLKAMGAEIDWTCVERNYGFYEVGKRVLPECQWVHDDVFKFCSEYTGEKKQIVISNPPFGNIATAPPAPQSHMYRHKNFEFWVIEAAKAVAERGVFLLPQGSAPFSLSGMHTYSENTTGKASVFTGKTGIVLEPNCGIDTSYYIEDWHGVSIATEVVLTDYDS